MKTYRAFVEWFQCACGCKPTFGVARLFAEGREPFKLAADGMPDAAWAWACNIELTGKTIWIRAALTAPPIGSLRCMKAAARLLGAEWLTWERLDEGTGKLEQKTFPCFPAAALDPEIDPSPQSQAGAQTQSAQSQASEETPPVAPASMSPDGTSSVLCGEDRSHSRIFISNPKNLTCQ